MEFEDYNLQLYFYNVFTFKDKTGTLDVYLSSHDGNPNYIFDTFEILPDLEVLSNYTNLEKQNFF